MAAHAKPVKTNLMMLIKYLDALTRQQIKSLDNIILQPSDPCWSTNDLLSLQALQDLLLVAFIDDIPIGYMVAKAVADEVEIHTLVVDHNQRKKGVGKALIVSLCNYALHNHIIKIFLEVKQSNATARQLYASQGFEKIGVRQQYYALENGLKQDAYVLCKSLFVCVK